MATLEDATTENLGAKHPKESWLEETTKIQPVNWRKHFALKYEWIIEGPFYAEVPETRQTYLQLLESGQGQLHTIKKYLLETLIIKDHFGNYHSARREFRKALEPSAQEWLDEHSKLRTNRLGPIVSAMDFLIGLFKDIDTDLYRDLQELFKPWYNSESAGALFFGLYVELPFQEKAKIARQIDDVAYRFLERLSR